MPRNTSKIDSIIGPLIRQLSALRQRKGLTQRDVAARMDFPQSYLSRLENVQIDMRLSNFVDLARFLGVEVMLIPTELIPTVNTIVGAEPVDEDSRPRWQLSSFPNANEADDEL